MTLVESKNRNYGDGNKHNSLFKKTHTKKKEVVFTHDSLHVKCLLLQGAV